MSEAAPVELDVAPDAKVQVVETPVETSAIEPAGSTATPKVEEKVKRAKVEEKAKPAKVQVNTAMVMFNKALTEVLKAVATTFMEHNDTLTGCVQLLSQIKHQPDGTALYELCREDLTRLNTKLQQQDGTALNEMKLFQIIHWEENHLYRRLEAVPAEKTWLWEQINAMIQAAGVYEACGEQMGTMQNLVADMVATMDPKEVAKGNAVELMSEKMWGDSEESQALRAKVVNTFMSREGILNVLGAVPKAMLTQTGQEHGETADMSTICEAIKKLDQSEIDEAIRQSSSAAIKGMGGLTELAQKAMAEDQDAGDEKMPDSVRHLLNSVSTGQVNLNQLSQLARSAPRSKHPSAVKPGVVGSTVATKSKGGAKKRRKQRQKQARQAQNTADNARPPSPNSGSGSGSESTEEPVIEITEAPVDPEVVSVNTDDLVGQLGGQMPAGMNLNELCGQMPDGMNLNDPRVLELMSQMAQNPQFAQLQQALQKQYGK